ncbi:MAG: VPLPA-CTERM sorting domain-containing protein [Pseudomonadota bacterium]
MKSKHKTRTMKHVLLAIAASSMVSATGASSATYSYIGEFFEQINDETPIAGTYDTTHRIVGSFTTKDPLQEAGFADRTALVESYSFSDGRNTFTQDNSVIQNFEITVDGTEITKWEIVLGSQDFPSAPLVNGEIFTRLITRSHLSGNSPSAWHQGTMWICLQASCSRYGSLGVSTANYDAGLSNTNGSWTTSDIAAPVPLPAGGLMLLSVIGALSWMRHLGNTSL